MPTRMPCYHDVYMYVCCRRARVYSIHLPPRTKKNRPRTPRISIARLIPITYFEESCKKENATGVADRDDVDEDPDNMCSKTQTLEEARGSQSAR